MREIFPIVDCQECGETHDTYDCPKCGAWTASKLPNTCPRCQKGSELELVKRKDRQLIEGKFSRVCEPCIASVIHHEIEFEMELENGLDLS